MLELDRRDFIKRLALGGVILGIGGVLLPKPLEAASLAGQVEVLWLGHATTRITSTAGKVIVIIPFL